MPAKFLIAVALLEKAAAFAPITDRSTGVGMGSVGVASQSAGGPGDVPETCDFFGNGCACGSGDLGAQCILLGNGAVDPREVDAEYINYCYNYCFADGKEFKSTITGGKAPCYQQCKNTAIMWQQAACSPKYELDTASFPESVFYQDKELCAGTVESGDFCEEYDPDIQTEWVQGTCQRGMKKLRNKGGTTFEGCDKPYTAECSQAACESQLWMGLNSMMGGSAYLCQYIQDTGTCEPGDLMQIDDMDCEFEMAARRKLQDKLAELRLAQDK